MGFIEYYKKYGQWHQMFSLNELPDDVREDLKTLIESEDITSEHGILPSVTPTGLVIWFP